MIEYSKKKDKYILYTHDGSRVLGTHDTYEQALRQERAIQWSKHHRKNPKLNGSLCKLDKNGYLLNSKGTNIWYHGSGNTNLHEFVKSGKLMSTESNYKKLEWSRVWIAEDIGMADKFKNGGKIYKVRYKPTKIFCYDNVPDSFVDCVYNKLIGDYPNFFRHSVSQVENVAISLLAEGMDPKTEDPLHYLDYTYRYTNEKILQNYEDPDDYSYEVIDALDECVASSKGSRLLKEGTDWLDYFDETSIKRLIKVLLEDEQFCMYSEGYVISCLIENGYTAHMEEEWFNDNMHDVGVFYEDFDKVEIVGVARSNPITLTERHEYGVPMQFFNFYTDDGELVGEGDYEIINSFEEMKRWNHAPHEPELTALKNAINDQFPVGVLVDIKISRLHRGKGYGQQITRETIEHMIGSEGAKTILVIVEIHPEEPYDLLPWYEMQGFEDLHIKTKWGYPLMILR